MATGLLKWMERPDRPSVHLLVAAQTLIGRTSDADVLLIHPFVSRQHARILREKDGYYLVDLKSSHGTYVNGEKATRRLLQSGDRIRFGEDGVELVFLDNEAISTGQMDIWGSEALETSFRTLAPAIPTAGAGYSELQKISCILDFHYYWEKSFSAEATFQHVLTSSLNISGAERGFILLNGPEGLRYEVGMEKTGKLLAAEEFRASQSIVRRVAHEHKPVLMTERISEEFASSESIISLQLRAIACLPLEGLSVQTDAPDVLGILYLDSTKRMHSLSGLDQKILSKLAEEAGRVLEKVEMIKGLEERRKMESELALAQETQRTLLARSVPQLEGFEIRAYNQATRHVSGDFYDFLHLETGQMVGVLADVSGKGISAALLSALIQGALDMEFRSTRCASEVLNRVNVFLCEKSASNRFATLFLFVIDKDGNGECISAGHNPAYLFRTSTGKIEEIASGGLILGAFTFAKYQSQPLHLHPGDVLVIYSDGLTEAQNPKEAMFGEDRLRKLIRSEARSGAAALERSLLDAVSDFTEGHGQTDDITLVLVERCPKLPANK
jgi:sigma-B regulation protein RsbU (phosphoserine phosphatase)